MNKKRFVLGAAGMVLSIFMCAMPVFANVKSEDKQEEAAADVSTETEPEVQEEEVETEPLTPEANLSTVDDINNESDSGKQFMTVTTKQGDIFYIIVDRDNEGSENVYFLNQVDDADLEALTDDGTTDEDAEAEEAAKEQAELEAQQDKEAQEKADAEAAAAAETAESDDKGSGNIGGLLVLLIAGIGAAGGYLWYRTRTGKKKEPENPDPDDGYNEDEDSFDYPDESGKNTESKK